MKRRKRSRAEARPPDERPRAAPLLEREETIGENLGDISGQELERELEEYNAVSPILSASDLDASWQKAEDSGEETVGGHAPTPDQDLVDEIGRALGIEFQDNQPLRTHDEVLAKRDRHRWELDRRSADEQGRRRHRRSEIILPAAPAPETPETNEEDEGSASRGPDSMIGAVMENLTVGAGRKGKGARAGAKKKAGVKRKKEAPRKKK